MEVSQSSKFVAGILLITIPTIEYGGVFLLSLVRSSDPGYVQNPVRQALFRAGHAHAGVLVILSLISQLLVDAASGPAFWQWIARLGAPVGAILIPLGFFLSVAPPQTTEPNAWIRASYFGAVALGIGVITLGVLLVRAAVR